jgi:hypothetical protein
MIWDILAKIVWKERVRARLANMLDENCQDKIVNGKKNVEGIKLYIEIYYVLIILAW